MSLESFKNSAIIIAGQPKSGTTLLLSLIDGHKKIAVIPIDYKYLGNEKLQEDEELIPQLFGGIGLEEIFGSSKQNQAIYDYNNKELRLHDLNGFIENTENVWKMLFGKTELKRIKALYALVLGCDKNTVYENKKWCIKNPGYEFYLKDIFNDFPYAKIVYVYRDPRDVIVSRTIKDLKKRDFKRGVKTKKIDDLTRMELGYHYINQWKESIKAIQEYKERKKNQIHMVKYEDIVKNTDREIKKLSEFLEIEFSKNMLVPTFNGINWVGNSVREKHTYGKIKKINNTYEKFLSKRQINIIDTLLRKEINQLWDESVSPKYLEAYLGIVCFKLKNLIKKILKN